MASRTGEPKARQRRVQVSDSKTKKVNLVDLSVKRGKGGEADKVKGGALNAYLKLKGQK